MAINWSQLADGGSVTQGDLCIVNRSGVNYKAAQPASGGAVAWGAVTGTLANQTDLQAALDAKAVTGHNHNATYSPIAHTHPAVDLSDSTALGRSLVTAADAAAARTALALGTLATQNGTVSGTNTGDQTSVSGNAGTATTLQTPRNINGVSFNGSADITVTAAGSTLSDAVPNAKLATMTQKTYKGRTTTSTGLPEDVAVATLKTDLALVKGDVGLGNVDNTTDAGKPVSTAQQTALNLKADLVSPTFTGTPTLPTGTIATTQSAADSTTKVATTAFVTTADNLKANLISPSFTTPALGAATASSIAATGALTSSGGGIGYATGNGGLVTQATSKSTGATLNKLCGQVTMNAAALAAATIVSFTLTNSTIAATDVIHVQHQATGTFGAYTINARAAAGSAVITIRNNSAGSLAEAIVIQFAVIKAVTG